MIDAVPSRSFLPIGYRKPTVSILVHGLELLIDECLESIEVRLQDVSGRYIVKIFDHFLAALTNVLVLADALLGICDELFGDRRPSLGILSSPGKLVSLEKVPVGFVPKRMQCPTPLVRVSVIGYTLEGISTCDELAKRRRDVGNCRDKLCWIRRRSREGFIDTLEQMNEMEFEALVRPFLSMFGKVDECLKIGVLIDRID
nr:hypothetical protein [Natrinema caseinilyticum]